jgi:predicted transposase YbfD/YdcC
MKESFEQIEDPRQKTKVRHLLHEIIIMTICGVLANGDTYEEITDWCEGNREWLKERLGLILEYGVPSISTFEKVWRIVDREAFRKAFQAWVTKTWEKQQTNTLCVDGKTLRGSKDGDRNPTHVISVWVKENGLVLAQKAVGEKTNEITEVPRLLRFLDLEGCTVTADAMSCQSTITQVIAEQKGNYVLALKANQPALLAYAETNLKPYVDQRQICPDITRHQTTDKGHGRVEVREYFLSTDLDGSAESSRFAGIKAIGMVRSSVTKGEETTVEYRYYITSLTDVEAFAYSVRSHWSIENCLHYSLDISFNEDDSRIRKDNAPENLAIIRHFVLSALKQVPHNSRTSIKALRKRASYDRTLLSLALSFLAL